MTTKLRRTVHLVYDIATGLPEEAMPDLQVNAPPGTDQLYVLAFIDQEDGESNVYVLTKDHVDALETLVQMVREKESGIVLPGLVDVTHINGNTPK